MASIGSPAPTSDSGPDSAPVADGVAPGADSTLVVNRKSGPTVSSAVLLVMIFMVDAGAYEVRGLTAATVTGPDASRRCTRALMPGCFAWYPVTSAFT